MKEKIIQKLNERIERILEKEELTAEDYAILDAERMRIEMREMREAAMMMATIERGENHG